MPGPGEQKLVVVSTHGSEDPERATIPFVMATAALAMDAKATVILQANAVTSATKGCYEHVFAVGFDPLKKLVDAFVELGGTVLVCIPCIEHRHITQDQLIEKAQLAKAGRVVVEMLEATSVVSY